jgi:hypothetical protein
MRYFMGLLIPIIALSIPIIAICFSHLRKTQNFKIKEMELQKEMLELEAGNLNKKLKLMEEENKKLDKIIFNEKTEITDL